jgi:two-component system sensor histidine kinase KdpD
MVDLTPRALLNRLQRGVVYPPERATAALQNFFREPTLVALRELAMRQTAQSVEGRHWADEQSRAGTPINTADPVDRLLLVLDSTPASAALIRRGRRVADYLAAECLAVYVSKTAGLSHLTDAQRDNVQRHLNFARGLHIDATILEGDDVGETVVSYARAQAITQVFLLRQPGTTVFSLFTEGLVQRIVNLARDMQVTIVADRSARPGG